MIPTGKSKTELLSELLSLFNDDETIPVHEISAKNNKFIRDKNADGPITRPADEARELKKLFNELEKIGSIRQISPTEENGIYLPMLIERVTQ